MYRVGLVLSLVVVLAVSIYLMIENRPYLLLFGFCLIPIFMAGYRFRRAFLFVLFWALGGVFLLFLLLFRPTDWPWALGFLAGFGVVVSLAQQLNRINKEDRDLFRQRLQEDNRTQQRLRDENTKAANTNTNLTQDLTQLANLYLLTKDMVGSLSFSDIFSILIGVLKSAFEFSKSKLILIDEAKRPVGIEKIYQIETEPGLAPEVPGEEKGKEAILAKELREMPVEVEIQNFDRRLIKALFEKRVPFVITPQESTPQDVKLPLPDEIKSIIVAPLIVEGKIMGALTMENFSADVYNRFSILADQLALEIKKVRLYETVQQLAIMDGLTKVYVRRYFLERYYEEIKRSKRHRFKLSFIMVDIDHFKRYNDTYGHLLGDVALQEVAEILKNSIRRVDLVCRYGGEEFAMLLPETDKAGAQLVAERIRWAAESHSFSAYGQLSNVTVSLGVATFPEDATSPDELIDRADEALYRAKQTGRNRVVAYRTKPGLKGRSKRKKEKPK